MLKKIFTAIDFFWTALIYIIFPPLCPVCHEIVDERGQLCENCARRIFRLYKIKTPPEILSEVFILTKYRGGTRKILSKLKFQNDLSVLPALKNMLNQISNRAEVKNFLEKIDIATFVPLNEKRFKERGYNQTEIIFANWLAEKNLPLENFLIRHKATPRLFNLDPAERKKVLAGAFSPVKGLNLEGKKILLVDDIYTTGTTVSECAAVLKKCGAAEIYVMAFASDGD